MTEHTNWQYCVNNPLRFQFPRCQSNNESLSPSQSLDLPTPNGLCLCQETKQYKHQHNSHCGHPSIRHAGHIDYLVGNILHFQHGGHCDTHGAISLVDQSKLSKSEIDAVQMLQEKIATTMGFIVE